MLKHIVLHSPAIDNAGGYHDAGTEFAIGDEPETKVITAERAHELVSSSRAVSRTEAKAQEGEAQQGGAEAGAGKAKK